ncbi:hypothetical protein M0802_007211 [Mischocyttarus mexicanus]|nr:hypothetical protein M0802_007211 [Mischocyttarus mexicanus]
MLLWCSPLAAAAAAAHRISKLISCRNRIGFPGRTHALGGSRRYFYVTTKLSLKACTAESNVMQSSLEEKEEEEEEEEEPEITFDEFKERYRRLIPYMAFYAANNNLNVQWVPGKDLINLPTNDVSSLGRSNQYTFSRINNSGTRNVLNNYRPTNNNNNVQNQLRKFIPSVQYDPNQDNPDTDYFIPIRYNSKMRKSRKEDDGGGGGMEVCVRG